MTKQTQTIKGIKRLPNSHCGNPAFEFTFAGGLTLRTKANISDAYKVCAGWEGKRIDFETETTKSGRVRIVTIN